MFRIGISPDFYTSAKGHFEGVLSSQFDSLPEVEYVSMPPGITAAPEALDEFDAAIALALRVTSDSLRNVDRLAIVSRWGVGYDLIDVPALTAAGVALCITPNGVRRPVAEANLTMIFALAKNIFRLDRAARSGKWRGDLDRLGSDIDGKTLGSVGLGNIGSELFRISRSLGFGKFLACDPFAAEAHAASLGVELVDLDSLFRQSDFVTINCPLGKTTANLIQERHLRLMRPAAYLINMSRGGIVQHESLVKALTEKWIAGAGIDVYPTEPPSPEDPIFKLENAIVTPHALAWTELIMRNNGLEACRHVLSVMRGEIPEGVVNREVLERPVFLKKLERYKAAAK